MASILPMLPDLLSTVAAASSAEVAVAGLAEMVSPFGIASVDCVITERVFLRWDQSPPRHVFVQSGFPYAWKDRWPRQGLVDPILPATARSVWAVEIGALRQAGAASALKHALWQFLDDTGTSEGLSVPTHLPSAAFGAVAFLRRLGARRCFRPVQGRSVRAGPVFLSLIGPEMRLFRRAARVRRRRIVRARDRMS